MPPDELDTWRFEWEWAQYLNSPTAPWNYLGRSGRHSLLGVGVAMLGCGLVGEGIAGVGFIGKYSYKKVL